MAGAEPTTGWSRSGQLILGGGVSARVQDADVPGGVVRGPPDLVSGPLHEVYNARVVLCAATRGVPPAALMSHGPDVSERAVPTETVAPGRRAGDEHDCGSRTRTRTREAFGRKPGERSGGGTCARTLSGLPRRRSAARNRCPPRRPDSRWRSCPYGAHLISLPCRRSPIGRAGGADHPEALGGAVCAASCREVSGGDGAPALTGCQGCGGSCCQPCRESVRRLIPAVRDRPVRSRAFEVEECGGRRDLPPRGARWAPPLCARPGPACRVAARRTDEQGCSRRIPTTAPARTARGEAAAPQPAHRRRLRRAARH